MFVFKLLLVAGARVVLCRVVELLAALAGGERDAAVARGLVVLFDRLVGGTDEGMIRRLIAWD